MVEQMEVKAYIVGYEPEEFGRGRWSLLVEGVDAPLYCVNPDPLLDGSPFVNTTLEGKFRLECGRGTHTSDKSVSFTATRRNGLEGDWIIARGIFQGMFTEEHRENDYVIQSLVPVTADLDEDNTPPVFDAGQWVKLEGYLVFDVAREDLPALSF